MISIADLETRLGFTVPDSDQAQAFIDDAAALIQDVAEDGIDENDPPAAILPVITTMVRRALDNPVGHNSITEGSYAFQHGQASGIYLNRQEVKLVRRITGVSNAGSLALVAHTPFYNRKNNPGDLTDDGIDDAYDLIGDYD